MRRTSIYRQAALVLFVLFKELWYWLILLQTSRSCNKLYTQLANQDITGTKPIFFIFEFNYSKFSM